MQISPIKSTPSFGMAFSITPEAKGKAEEVIKENPKDAVRIIGALEYLKAVYNIQGAKDLTVDIKEEKGKQKITFELKGPSDYKFAKSGKPSRMLKNGPKVAKKGERFIEGRIDSEGQHASKYAVQKYLKDVEKLQAQAELDAASDHLEEI